MNNIRQFNLHIRYGDSWYGEDLEHEEYLYPKSKPKPKKHKTQTHMVRLVLISGTESRGPPWGPAHCRGQRSPCKKQNSKTQNSNIAKMSLQSSASYTNCGQHRPCTCARACISAVSLPVTDTNVHMLLLFELQVPQSWHFLAQMSAVQAAVCVRLQPL